MASGTDVEILAERVRAGIDRPVVAKRMFAGLVFMLDGRMLCCVSAKGLMVRVGAAAETEALKRPFVARCLGAGRAMAGFLLVERLFRRRTDRGRVARAPLSPRSRRRTARPVRLLVCRHRASRPPSGRRSRRSWIEKCSGRYIIIGNVAAAKHRSPDTATPGQTSAMISSAARSPDSIAVVIHPISGEVCSPAKC